MRELQYRFDGLPVHSLIYCQSYNQGVLQMLIDAKKMRSCQAMPQSQILQSKLNQTGNNRDCLGMTPHHILACTSVHNIEIYRVIIDNYHTNLITEDG